MKEITITARQLAITIYAIFTIVSTYYYFTNIYVTGNVWMHPSQKLIEFYVLFNLCVLLVMIPTFYLGKCLDGSIKRDFTLKVPIIFTTSKRDHFANYGELIQKGDKESANDYYEEHIKDLVQ